MREIYADFNDIATDRILPLSCSGSRSSITSMSEELRNGERVRLTDGELAVFATVYLRADGSWEAHSDWHFFPANT